MKQPSSAELRQRYRESVEEFNRTAAEVVQLAAERRDFDPATPLTVEGSDRELRDAIVREAAAFEAMTLARKRLFGQ